MTLCLTCQWFTDSIGFCDAKSDITPNNAIYCADYQKAWALVETFHPPCRKCGNNLCEKPCKRFEIWEGKRK